MLYVTETRKDVETAARDLEAAVKRNKFGVLHVHDLQKTLKEKGVDFPNACKILEDSEHRASLPDLGVPRGRQDGDRHDPADGAFGLVPRGR
jgi:hypothetical protein